MYPSCYLALCIPLVCFFSTLSSISQLRKAIDDTVENLKCAGKKEPNEINESSKSTFLLVLQTKFQKELLHKYGNTISMMDGIYRTTKYGFPCFFITVKTSLGMGRVAATIISQDESEELLIEGLRLLKK